MDDSAVAHVDLGRLHEPFPNVGVERRQPAHQQKLGLVEVIECAWALIATKPGAKKSLHRTCLDDDRLWTGTPSKYTLFHP